MKCDQLVSLKVEYSVVHLTPDNVAVACSKSKVQLQTLSFKGSVFFNERSRQICEAIVKANPNLQVRDPLEDELIALVFCKFYCLF